MINRLNITIQVIQLAENTCIDKIIEFIFPKAYKYIVCPFKKTVKYSLNKLFINIHSKKFKEFLPDDKINKYSLAIFHY